MWSFKRRAFAVLSVALPLALPLGLASCGFQPLYGRHSVDPSIQRELASISVGSIPDREGQLTRNAILSRLNPTGEPAKPEYFLNVHIGISEAEQALRKDDTSTRNQVTYTLTYYLRDSERNLTSGTFSRTFSYDFLEGQYNNISAHDDTRKRAAESLAEDVRTSLAAYFIRAKKAAQRGQGY